MKYVREITIVILVIIVAVLGFLYFKETQVTCSCKECKESNNKKSGKDIIISQDVSKTFVDDIEDNLKDGYEVLGVVSTQGEYEKIVRQYTASLQTDCVAEMAETDCISTEPEIKKKDFNNYVYVLIIVRIDTCGGTVSYQGHYFDKNTLNIMMREHSTCGPCPISYDLFEIGIDKYEYDDEKVKVEFEYDKADCDPDVAYKPVMYLYPDEDMDLNVTFKNPDKLTTTYPKYNNGWDVRVLKDGSIYDKDNNYYYALYWESIYERKVDFSEGFYVSGEDAIKFLEEKLTLLGLNDRERNEFIMYWLPIMEQNEKNLIYFETTEELNKYEPIEFSIEPDTLIRIRMHIKKVDKEVSIKEQKIETPVRNGFTAVEWGGVKY